MNRVSCGGKNLQFLDLYYDIQKILRIIEIIRYVRI